MQRRIVGFHTDTEAHWVAELDCGHAQHVRHDPPWQLRPWVLTEASRRQHLGTELDCRLCDEDDARVCGLCEEGVAEIAARPKHPPG